MTEANELIKNLSKSYSFHMNLALDLSKQPELNDHELLSIWERVRQCKLLATILHTEAPDLYPEILEDFERERKEIIEAAGAESFHITDAIINLNA